MTLLFRCEIAHQQVIMTKLIVAFSLLLYLLNFEHKHKVVCPNLRNSFERSSVYQSLV